MFSFLVVVGKPDCQVFEKLSSGFVCLQVDSLVFQGTPESFDKDVVLESPLAVHADPYVPGLEDGGESFAGKLASLVGVEDLRRAVFEQCLFQRFDTESGVQSVGQPPGQNPSGGPVHDRYQVHVSPCHGEIGDVGCPNLIGPVNGHSPQQVGIDRMFRLSLAGAGFGGQGLDTHDEHQATYSISSHRGFRRREMIDKRATAHPGMLHVKFVDPAHQFQITGTQT